MVRVEEMEYMILLISVFLACIAAKFAFKLQLFKSKKNATLTLVSLFIIGSTLDSFALMRGYWNFQQEFFVGITIGVMPLEEYIFLIVIPFLTIVIYRLVNKKIAS
jgi:lycopene cyclase domain-containing protein